MYAFIMSAAITLRAFDAAIVSALPSVSLDTTLAYVTVAGTLVMCPPIINGASWQMSSIFTVNIMWHLTNWYPLDGCTPSSKGLNPFGYSLVGNVKYHNISKFDDTNTDTDMSQPVEFYFTNISIFCVGESTMSQHQNSN